MARKPGIEIDGALYHIITRGNQSQKIFKDKEDYTRYLAGDFYKDTKGITLWEIDIGIDGAHGITLKEIKDKGKDRDTMLCRKLFSLIARENG